MTTDEAIEWIRSEGGELLLTKETRAREWAWFATHWSDCGTVQKYAVGKGETIVAAVEDCIQKLGIEKKSE